MLAKKPRKTVKALAEVIRLMGMDPATAFDGVRQRVLELGLEFRSTGLGGADGIGLEPDDIGRLAASYGRAVDRGVIRPARPASEPRPATTRRGGPMPTEAPAPGVWSLADACRLLGKNPDTDFPGVRYRARRLGIAPKPTQHACGRGLDLDDLGRLAASYGVSLDWDALSEPRRSGDWLRGVVVARRLGLPGGQVPAMAVRTRIRVLELPGKPPRYHREDVERVLRNSIKVGGKPLPEGATV